MTVSIQPVVNWPREVTVGQAYLVTADIVLAEASGWPYEREEFVVGCVLEGGSTFSVEALGSTGLVLHRFGGTYGPVEFVVRALREPAPDGPDELRLTFLTEGGLPFRTVQLSVRPQGAGGPASPSTVVEVASATAPPAGVQPTGTPPAQAASPERRSPAPMRRRPVTGRAARRSALLFGIPKPISISLRSDVEAMTDALAVHGFAMTVLVGADATKEAVRHAYEDLIAATGPDDAVFVYANCPEPGERPGDFTGADFTAWHDRLAAITPNVTVAFECSAFGEDPPDAGIVKLFAAGPGQLPYGLPHSVFSEVLARTLHEVGDRPVTWAVVMDRVRRRVLDRRPLQRPMIVGPARRVVFQLAEAEPETSLPVVAAPDGTLLLDGAPLLGVQVGDEFAIMPPGAAGPDDDEAVCAAEVVALTPVAAVAEPRPALSRAVPRGSRAYRTRAVAVATPIKVPAHEGLLAAMAASHLVRPAGPEEPCTYEVRADDAGLLSIHDTIGPVQDPRSADVTGLIRVVADLEQLARAHALRTLTEDPRWAFDPPMEIEWGLVDDGVPQPRPASGDSVHAGDRLFIRIRNTGAETVFVSLIDIGVAAGVTLLSSSDPGGVAMAPGAEYAFGADPGGELRGVPLSWPERLDPSHARPETVLVLITSAPQEMRMLEQRGIRAAPPRPSSMLERTLTQITTGAAQPVGAAGDRAVRYAVRPINFFLHPSLRPDVTFSVPPAPAARLADLARRLRERTDLPQTDDEIADLIDDQIEVYRRRLGEDRTARPPQDLQKLLPLMGWLIYEMSWRHLINARTDTDGTSAVMVHRMAEAARGIPWPQYAPRALGAFRAAALVESRRDTLAGYNTSMLLLREARERWQSYRASHVDPDQQLAFDEILLQLALAETGVVCRLAERTIIDWSPASGDADEDQWVQRLFGELTAAAAVGEQALDVADTIERTVGFVDRVTADRLALTTSRRNPAIMTARVLLLLFSLAPAMQTLDRRPPEATTWEAHQRDLLDRIGRAIDALARPLGREDGLVSAGRHQQRAFADIVLHLAVVAPGHSLRHPVEVPEVAVIRLLDDDIAERAAAWLSESSGRLRSGWGVIGSATMPAFLLSVEQCRRDRGATSTYLDWRLRWPQLDRLGSAPGRVARITRSFVGAADRAAMADSFLELGRRKEENNDHAGAEESYQQALDLFEQAGDRVGMAAGNHQLGILAYKRGDYAEAERRYRLSLIIDEERGNRAGMASSFHQLGVLARVRGDYADAKRLHHQALTIAEELGDRAGAAGSNHELGNLAYLTGDYAEAERRYQQSLAVAEELADRRGMANGYHQLGLLAQDRGDLSGAEEWYQRALAIVEELGDRANAAGSHHQLGNLALLRGDHAEAERRYQESLAISEELGNRATMAMVYHQLGILAQDEEDYAEAERRYQQSLAIAEELGNRAGMASTNHQLGILAQDRGDLDQAERRYLESLRIKEELGNRAGVATGNHQLGVLAQTRGDLEEAERRYVLSLGIDEELGNRAGVATSFSQLGILRAGAGDLATAVKFHVRALAIRLEIGVPQAQRSLTELSDLRTRLGDEAFSEAIAPVVDEQSLRTLNSLLEQLSSGETA